VTKKKSFIYLFKLGRIYTILAFKFSKNKMFKDLFELYLRFPFLNIHRAYSLTKR